MENTPSFHPLDYVSVLRRRLWWLVAPAAIAVIVGLGLVMWLPRTYQAQATIGVSLPGVSGQLLNDTQRVTPEERARNISQTLLSQSVLERVVREEGLDKYMSLPDAVQKVRTSVDVKVPLPTPNMPPGSVEQFDVLYQNGSAKEAQRVTNRLADVFVEETSRKRAVRAEETSMFIQQQVDASKARLDQLENQLKDAKEAYMGALPEQTNANVALVTGSQQELQTVNNAIASDQDRLSNIERQISAMETGGSSDSSAPTMPSTAAARVLSIQHDLATARATYTDKHPEVLKLQDELAKAQADAKAEAARPVSDRQAILRMDPSYKALISEREDIKLRIAAGKRSAATIQGLISQYRMRVDAAPRVEQQMAALKSEYDLERTGYVNLTNKLRDAQMNESLERKQGGERFTVLQHASLPDTPFSPNIPRLLVLVLLVGLCLGGGLALGREYLDRSIHDARVLTDLELPVLGEIPRITAGA